MHIVVTGGSGAIGTFVVEELLRDGHDVTVFDQVPPDSEPANFIQGDVTKRESVRRIPSHVDGIIHLAALLASDCTKDPVHAEQVNVYGTLLILDRAHNIDARAIVTSSIAAIGPITGKFSHPEYEPLGEDANKNPINSYGVTKIACEHYVESYRRDFDLPAITIRFPTTYGPGKTHNHSGPGGFISVAIEETISGGSLRIADDDKANDFIYFRDIARAITMLMNTANWSYSTYHIGSGDLHNFGDFGSVLEREYPDSNVIIDQDLSFEDHGSSLLNCLLDISRIKSDTGFEPKFTPAMAIEDYDNRVANR